MTIGAAILSPGRQRLIAAAVFAAAFLVTGCSPNKFMAEGEALYRGAEIEMTGPEIPQKEKVLKQNVSSKLQPKPNRKFLGLFYTKIWLHEKVTPKPNKEKSLKHWLKNKIGEKPVLVSSVDTTAMNLVVSKLFQDYGLFHTKVNAEIISHRRQAKVRYSAKHQGVYRIGTLRLPEARTPVDSIVRAWDGFSIDTGKIYTLRDFKKDRLDLAEHIRDEGYFDFSERNILYLVDTTWSDHEFAVDIRIRPPDGDSLHRKYYIGRVVIHPTHDENVFADTVDTRREFTYKDFEIHQNYQYVGKKALDRFLLIRPGDDYSLERHNATMSRFINTSIFRYVNIDYEKRSGDTLDVDLFLTPTKYQGVKFDVEATTSNRSFLGSSVSASYNNGNLFRGAEYFTLKASAGTEFQIINDQASLNILNLRLDARLEVPGIIPIMRWNNPTEIMPRTFLELSENYQKWLEYYTYNSLKFGAGYNWRSKRGRVNHTLEVLSMEWVTLINKTQKFDDIIDENPLLKLSFETNMIFGRSYDISISSKRTESQRSYIYYLGGVEMAGNIGYISARILKPDKEGQYETLGIPFSNFSKLNSEVRHYFEINKDMTLVTRVGVGLGFAYGNSEVLPYSRQFTMGGPNTLRGFEFRTVGPGRYTSEDENGETNPIEQSGDIQLMMNLEWRFTMYRFLKGAFFMDAGNVWLRKDDPARPDGQFAFDRFYRELALSTGFGVRLDFDFFAIRVDLGVPLYKPFNLEGERWIPDFPESGFRKWRKANWAWNIAIGYPF